MNTVITNLIFVSLLWFGSGVVSSLICPPRCGCQSAENGYYNVKCANLGLKKPVNPNELPANTYKLDLSRNAIETIRNYAFKAINQTKIKWLILDSNGLKMIEPKAFAGLDKLIKIDLSQNQLTSLPGDVFKDLKNVKNIDLSENKLFVINKTQFHGLKKLRNINLSSNKLSILPDGLFSSLNDLKKIDLQLNRIICDCNLKWMVKWMANLGRRLSILGRCEYPLAFKGTKIAHLTRKETVCDKLQLPVMAFGPQGDQIAFKGDSYTFDCTFSWIPNTQITWYKDNQLIPVEPKGNHRNIVFKFDSVQVVLATVLDIKQLSFQDSGHYRCNVSYPGGYQHVRTSRLSIIPSDTSYCQAATTETDRGTFHWHNTAAGGAAFLPCPVGVISSLSDQRGSAVMARRRCSFKGAWMDVEAEPCIHTNEITRALHDLKEKSVNDTTVSSVSKQLLVISKRAKEFSNPLDVVYAAEVVDNLAHAIGDDFIFNKELVNSVSNIMETDVKLLLEAQRRFKACSSMVLSLDSVHTRFPSDIFKNVAFVSKNIAVFLVRVTASDVVGKICYVTTGTNSSFKEIGCLPCKNNTSCERQMQAVDTSIYLPSSLFQHILVDVNVQFQLIVFSNSILFPEITKRETGPSAEVTSSVVSAQFRRMVLTNLTQPVIFKFRNHQDGKQPIPVYWDLDDNDGRGNWKKNEDCGPVLIQDNNTLITTCFQPSNKNFIGVMMNVSKPGGAGDTRLGALRNFHRGVMELIVYVGAGIASLLLLTTLIVYAVIRELRFDRDDAAMLMNQCLALIVTIVVFVTGINRVTNVLVCRSVGVLLHYFLLCTLLWIGCSGICLHRLIRIAIQPEEYNPVLRYYMMSWGIPVIICGITIAGNPENYQVEDYCWLRLNPFYGAFLGPACLIILIDLIVFLRLWNLIKSVYDIDTETSSQTASEGEAETAAEENALVIQQEPSASVEENAESVDKSALPDKGEMTDLLRGNLVILLVVILNIILGIMLVRYQQSHTLHIALSCLFTVALVILGVAVFIFHCYRKGKIRSLWDKHCFKCRCLRGKRYEIQQEIPEAETVEETPEDKTTANTANGDAGQFTGEEIHGAKNLLSLGDGDSASNVSLPSSAAITLDKQVVQLPDKEPESQAEKASSVSDKQSWASAPLPLQYKPRGKLLKNPPGYRHSYTENERATPTIAECHKVPLVPPEGTASSVASSVQLPTDTASNIAASEGPSSVHDAVEAANVSRNTNTSCSASEVSIPIDIPTLKKRPPIPGSSSHGSDVAPPIPFKKPRQPAPVVRENPAVSRPTPTTQELIDQYSFPAATTSSIPRHIPRDHVVVRERYHIPYEPRALSEKPRDHYQILPLPTNARDHYLLQPGHDQYEDPRGQHLIPNPHSQYQVAPEHFAMPGDQKTGQLTHVHNQVPSPAHARPHDYYHLPCDTIPSPRAHDLYQMARDLASPRSNDSHQAPHEQNPGRGQHDHSPGQRTHEQNQVPSDHIRPRSPNHNYISHEPCFGPRSPDHSQVSHDSSAGQRSHDHYQVPRDYMPRVQHHADRPYENIPGPNEQSSLQRAYERNAPSLSENEPSRDQAQTPRDPNMTNDIVHGPTHEGLERAHDQYAGEGPREQPQALNLNEKSPVGDQRPGLSLDKNGVGVRPQNAASGTREQPKGIHVSRRRSRNPYQIARDIHNNLGIETRSRDRQSRRAQRTPPAEQSSQPVKTYGQLQVSSPVETPKERTPRSSMSSWKEDRPKPSKKDWASDKPKTAVFVPIPHLKRSTPEPPRNETSV